jgi:hypothetical protein
MNKLLLILPLLSACAAPAIGQPEGRAGGPATVASALCRLGFRAVPLRTLPTGHHLVEVRLNGRPATFVLDTGAGATVLNAAEARNFGVGGTATAQGGAIGLGGAQAASLYAIESFAIGAMPTRQRRIATLNLAQITNTLSPIAGRPIHGIVGQDLLAEHRAVIDVSAPAVYLMERDAGPAPVAASRCR